MVKANLFATSLNYEPSRWDIDLVGIYGYDDPLEAPLILKACLEERDLNTKFTKKIKFEEEILKFCFKCEKYYDEVKVSLAEKRELDRFDLVE